MAQRARLRDRQDSLAETLAGYLRETHRLAVDPEVWADKPLADHLRVRVQVVDERGQPLAASRDLAELHGLLAERQRELSAEVAREESAGLAPRPRPMGEREPDGVDLWRDSRAGARVRPGGRAGVRLSGARAGRRRGGVAAVQGAGGGADAAMRRGLSLLFELKLRYELAWLQRDLRDLRALGVLAAAWLPVEALQEQAYADAAPVDLRARRGAADRRGF